MSATVLDFQQAVRRRNGIDRKPCVHDAITQAVMDHFKSYPISIVELAIQSARYSLACGGGFIDAMDAAARTVEKHAPRNDLSQVLDARNQDRIDRLNQRRERRTAALLDIAERMIRAYLKNQPEAEITGALQRAYRVLMGNGSLCNAIYHATNIGTESA